MGLFDRPEKGTGKRAEAAPYNVERGLTASAARVRLTDRRETEELRQRASTALLWQTHAWRCYDEIGEVSFAFNLIASLMSRIRVHAAVITQPDSSPTELTNAISQMSGDKEIGNPNGVPIEMARKAQEFMASFSKGTSTAMMLRAYALNMQIAGECYLTEIKNNWSVKSTSEIQVDTGGAVRYYPSSSTISSAASQTLPSTTPIGRIWRQHPKHSMDPDSSMRPVLADCEELIMLSRMIRATTRSRMNAGILFVPDTFTTAASTIGEEQGGEDGTGTEEEDTFEAELLASMTAPISDEQSSASVVPMVVRGPADQGQYLKYITVSRDATNADIARAAALLDRILNGLDAPKDKITGMKNVKYSNALSIDEGMYREHVEPLVLLFVDAITDIFLGPMMRAEAMVQGWDLDDVARIVVWYDPSEIVTRSDQGADADSGYEKNVLSARAWRKAHGFSEDDAPDDEELARQLVAKAIAPPDVLEALFNHVLSEVLAKAKATAGASLPPELSQALNNTGTVAPAEAPPATADVAEPVPAVS